MINAIIKKLKEIEPVVCYGNVTSQDVPDGAPWDYIVIAKSTTKQDGYGRWYDTYSVTIVRDGYIPEGYVIDVINKISEVKGLRISFSDVNYDYYVKANTDDVVEAATFTVKAVTRKCT